MALIARLHPSILPQLCLYSAIRTTSRCNIRALVSRPIRPCQLAAAVGSNRGITRTFTASTAAHTSVREKKYTKDHEWIELSPDGKTGTIGISVYAAKALGDVVFIELPTVGTKFGAGDTIGAVESVKSASDILAPQAGTVVAKNDLLEEKPGIINTSPEEYGWIAKIELKNDEKDVEGLMSLEEYRKLTEEE